MPQLDYIAYFVMAVGVFSLSMICLFLVLSIVNKLHWMVVGTQYKLKLLSRLAWMLFAGTSYAASNSSLKSMIDWCNRGLCSTNHKTIAIGNKLQGYVCLFPTGKLCMISLVLGVGLVGVRVCDSLVTQYNFTESFIVASKVIMWFVVISCIVGSAILVYRAPWYAGINDVHALEGEIVRAIVGFGCLWGYFDATLSHALCNKNEQHPVKLQPEPEKVPARYGGNAQDPLKYKVFIKTLCTHMKTVSKLGFLPVKQAPSCFSFLSTTDPELLHKLANDPDLNKQYIDFVKLQSFKYSPFKGLYHKSVKTSASEAPHFLVLSKQFPTKSFVKNIDEAPRSPDLLSTDGSLRFSCKTPMSKSGTGSTIAGRISMPQHPAVNAVSYVVPNAVLDELNDHFHPPKAYKSVIITPQKEITSELAEDYFNRVTEQLTPEAYDKAQTEVSNQLKAAFDAMKT